MITAVKPMPPLNITTNAHISRILRSAHPITLQLISRRPQSREVLEKSIHRSRKCVEGKKVIVRGFTAHTNTNPKT